MVALGMETRSSTSTLLVITAAPRAWMPGVRKLKGTWQATGNLFTLNDREKGMNLLWQDVESLVPFVIGIDKPDNGHIILLWLS
jgi:hypothetical protein